MVCLQVRLQYYRDITDIPVSTFTYCARYLGIEYGSMRPTARWLRNARNQETVYPVVVAYCNRNPVGWAFVDCTNRVMMYVKPEFRHRRCATKMLVMLMRRNSERGLDVYHGNTYATPTYQRALGYLTKCPT